ncbi:MAG TPA: heavy metal-binding domain-containing protein [Candidatus Sumerlaeota bacterium]|nr:heavy metal-binding domain-containing protein [Candidatus Sumerlaeota bacterium]
MIELAFAFLSLLGFFVLILVGLFGGMMTERRHLRRLAEAEQALRPMLCTDLRRFPGRAPGAVGGTLVVGQVVIASDYLKTFLSKWRLIFGGEIRSFRGMMTRARREAVVRMLSEARARGFDAVCNVRFSTADIGGMTTSEKANVMVEVVAYGTAYHARPDERIHAGIVPEVVA